MNIYDIVIPVIPFLIGIIALGISMITFWSYGKIRNWRLLFLGAAFLMLSVPYLLNSILMQGATDFYFLGITYNAWDLSIIEQTSFVWSMLLIFPFFLLAYVYSDEVRHKLITINRIDRIIGVILATIGIVTLMGQQYFIFGLLFIERSLDWPFICFMASSVAICVLMTIIIVSQISFYRARRTRSTVLVIAGFFCLFFSQGFGPFFYIMIDLSMASLDLVYFVPLLIELAGYFFFLAAVLRLRLFK